MNETGIIRRIADLIDHEHRVYLYFASPDAMEEFQRRAKSERIRFGDSIEADERKLAPIMRLLDDRTICYAGFAGTVAYHSRQADILRVDFEKYAAGCTDYRIAL